MPSVIIVVQNRSLGGHFPKFVFALWSVQTPTLLVKWQAYVTPFTWRALTTKVLSL